MTNSLALKPDEPPHTNGITQYTIGPSSTQALPLFELTSFAHC